MHPTATPSSSPTSSTAPFGPQEPPNDPRIYNRRQADGTYPPLSGFFDAPFKGREAVEEVSATPSSYTPDERAVIERFLKEQRDVVEAKYDAEKNTFLRERYGNRLDVIVTLLNVASRPSVSL